jgi:serine/threonine protein kinase
VDIEIEESPFLGRWTLIEKFTGGMSQVWRAHDAITEMEWVLKIPSDEIDATLYEREARVLLGIEPHPNVVILQSIARYRGRPVIVMQYHDQGSLRRWIGSPRLLVDHALDLRLAMQICDGFAHMKRHGVVAHGDLKPDNVLMWNREMAAVTDFGLARSRRDRSKGGTPAYMAPEIAAGGDIDETSDVYSFGCTLYEMLSGSCPRPFVSEPIDGISASLEELIRACMAKERQRRPGGFEVIRERLAAIYNEMVGIDAPEPLEPLDLGALDWTMRGLGLCSLGLHEEETRFHRKAVEIDPGNAEALSRLADNLRERGLLEEAKEWAARALEIDDSFHLSRETMGSVLDDLGDFDGAEVHYRRAVALQPQDPEVWYNFGLALQRNERWAEAIDAYRKALAIEPRLSHAWSNLGVTYENIGDLRRAEEAYRNALHHEPCLPQAVECLAALLCREERYAQAVHFCDDIVGKCPANADTGLALHGLGLAFLDAMQLDAADHAFAAAIEIRRAAFERNADPTVLNHLAGTHKMRAVVRLRMLPRQLDPRLLAEAKMEIDEAMHIRINLIQAAAESDDGIPLTLMHDYAMTLYTRSGVMATMGDFSAAKSTAASALELMEDLVSDNPEWEGDLDLCRANLAQLTRIAKGSSRPS